MVTRSHMIESMTLEAAQMFADTAVDVALEKGLKIHVTVVDAAGHVLVYQRMVGAPFPAREFSEKKAYTAVSFKKPTSAWKDRLNDNPHLAAGLSQHPKVAMIGGGAPVFYGDECIGAVGIAGGLEGDDIEVVKETLKRTGHET
ncbi:uncharacterized protein GlcG (DUF336 family) [Rhodobium orientis]|uniref:Cobalamin adenosyltransferase n=1 Tax=Rhodobium orientis TaxID=34017 RepID=A0A327JW70_9HYPH|nr:heme-binding protein [Rhodobium orientis]MBB4302544.1 uncharacterized protein GlcG (DUF336 family) [Rhodobium orientis]MBK5949393.1 hypothetical protein [Rhodobium orientis]RAI29172.1 hypothetical protein CH339_04215 [Rhodobium orientis]